uniref:Uncharacterized protein n=1 Tax=Bombyx mori TaxID=7091 RepID=A0A8R2M0R2_BOMMO|nr:uncharacterized protein LOC101740721 isoform X2 [Bombyx mori]
MDWTKYLVLFILMVVVSSTSTSKKNHHEHSHSSHKVEKNSKIEKALLTKSHGPFSSYGLFASAFSDHKTSHRILKEISELKAATNLNEAFHGIYLIAKVVSDTIEEWIPELGTAVARLFLALGRGHACLPGGALKQLAKDLDLDICKKDYGVEWGWEYYEGEYDDVSTYLTGCGLDSDYFSKITSLIENSGNFTEGRPRIIIKAVKELLEIFKRDPSSWSLNEFGIGLAQLIKTAAVLAESYRVGLGTQIVDGFRQFFYDVSQEYGIEITTQLEDIKEAIKSTKCFNFGVLKSCDSGYTEIDDLNDNDKPAPRQSGAETVIVYTDADNDDDDFSDLDEEIIRLFSSDEEIDDDKSVIPLDYARANDESWYVNDAGYEDTVLDDNGDAANENTDRSGGFIVNDSQATDTITGGGKRKGSADNDDDQRVVETFIDEVANSDDPSFNNKYTWNYIKAQKDKYSDGDNSDGKFKELSDSDYKEDHRSQKTFTKTVVSEDSKSDAALKSPTVIFENSKQKSKHSHYSNKEKHYLVSDATGQQDGVAHETAPSGSTSKLKEDDTTTEASSDEKTGTTNERDSKSTSTKDVYSGSGLETFLSWFLPKTKKDNEIFKTTHTAVTKTDNVDAAKTKTVSVSEQNEQFQHKNHRSGTSSEKDIDDGKDSVIQQDETIIVDSQQKKDNTATTGMKSDEYDDDPNEQSKNVVVTKENKPTSTEVTKHKHSHHKHKHDTVIESKPVQEVEKHSETKETRKEHSEESTVTKETKPTPTEITKHKHSHHKHKHDIVIESKPIQEIEKHSETTETTKEQSEESTVTKETKPTPTEITKHKHSHHKHDTVIESKPVQEVEKHSETKETRKEHSEESTVTKETKPTPTEITKHKHSHHKHKHDIVIESKPIQEIEKHSETTETTKEQSEESTVTKETKPTPTEITKHKHSHHKQKHDIVIESKPIQEIEKHSETTETTKKQSEERTVTKETKPTPTEVTKHKHSHHKHKHDIVIESKPIQEIEKHSETTETAKEQSEESTVTKETKPTPTEVTKHKHSHHKHKHDTAIESKPDQEIDKHSETTEATKEHFEGNIITKETKPTPTEVTKHTHSHHKHKQDTVIESKPIQEIEKHSETTETTKEHSEGSTVTKETKLTPTEVTKHKHSHYKHKHDTVIESKPVQEVEQHSETTEITKEHSEGSTVTKETKPTPTEVKKNKHSHHKHDTVIESKPVQEVEKHSETTETRKEHSEGSTVTKETKPTPTEITKHKHSHHKNKHDIVIESKPIQEIEKHSETTETTKEHSEGSTVTKETKPTPTEVTKHKHSHHKHKHDTAIESKPDQEIDKHSETTETTKYHNEDTVVTKDKTGNKQTSTEVIKHKHENDEKSVTEKLISYVTHRSVDNSNKGNRKVIISENPIIINAPSRRNKYTNYEKVDFTKIKQFSPLAPFGVFARGITSKCEESAALFSSLSRKRSPRSFREAVDTVVATVRAISLIVDGWIPTLGTRFADMVMVILKTQTCVPLKQEFPELAYVCDASFGSAWGWTSFPTCESRSQLVRDLGLVGIKHTIETMLSQHGKGKAPHQLIGSPAVIAQSIHQISIFYEQDPEEWNLEHLAATFARTTTILGALGNSYKSGLGQFMAEGFLNYFKYVGNYYQIDLSIYVSKIYKDLTFCKANALEGVILDGTTDYIEEHPNIKYVIIRHVHDQVRRANRNRRNGSKVYEKSGSKTGIRKVIIVRKGDPSGNNAAGYAYAEAGPRNAVYNTNTDNSGSVAYAAAQSQVNSQQQGLNNGGGTVYLEEAKSQGGQGNSGSVAYATAQSQASSQQQGLGNGDGIVYLEKAKSQGGQGNSGSVAYATAQSQASSQQQGLGNGDGIVYLEKTKSQGGQGNSGSVAYATAQSQASSQQQGLGNGDGIVYLEKAKSQGGQGNSGSVAYATAQSQASSQQQGLGNGDGIVYLEKAKSQGGQGNSGSVAYATAQSQASRQQQGLNNEGGKVYLKEAKSQGGHGNSGSVAYVGTQSQANGQQQGLYNGRGTVYLEEAKSQGEQGIAGSLAYAAAQSQANGQQQSLNNGGGTVNLEKRHFQGGYGNANRFTYAPAGPQLIGQQRNHINELGSAYLEAGRSQVQNANAGSVAYGALGSQANTQNQYNGDNRLNNRHVNNIGEDKLRAIGEQYHRGYSSDRNAVNTQIEGSLLNHSGHVPSPNDFRIQNPGQLANNVGTNQNNIYGNKQFGYGPQQGSGYQQKNYRNINENGQDKIHGDTEAGGHSPGLVGGLFKYLLGGKTQ